MIDSQNKNPESQNNITSNELCRTEALRQSLAHTHECIYWTYFVLIVDKESNDFDNVIDYIRGMSDNPKKEVLVYVGKHIGYDSEVPHDIAEHHSSKSRNSSVIVDLCETSDNAAFEVFRRKYNTVEEMELGEAFGTVCLLLLHYYDDLMPDK